MTQKLGWLALLIAMTLPAAARDRASVSGVVKDSSGVPQMGAKVEVIGASGIASTAFTDARGAYSVAGLASGLYQVKVSAPSFLPSLREKVSVRSGAALVVNVTLNTLFEALEWVPAQRASKDNDDWKWTLRSMANRPVLRVFADGPNVVVTHAEAASDRALKGQVAFLAGTDDGAGTSDLTTSFTIERSMFSSGMLAVDGNVAYNASGVVPDSVFRASYSHELQNGSRPEIALTVRRFLTPDIGTHSGSLQAIGLITQNTFAVSRVAEINVGSTAESIQYMGRVTAIKPFGSAIVHLSPNTVFEYRYATSVPNMRTAKGFDSAPADLSESGPRVSLSGGRPVIEHAHHHEMSLSRRVGPKNKVQIAYFLDRVSDPALAGVGELSNYGSGEFLADVYSGTFNYAGPDLESSGFRVVYERELFSEIAATFDYATGNVLQLSENSGSANLRENMTTERRQALACKISGKMPLGKGEWLASYRWVSGPALTAVDAFNDGPGQTEPFLNIFIRQQIPGTNSMPGHMEALVDLRNLLAQGYVPVLGQDRRTVYLVQSARAVRGGVAFTF